MQRTLLYPLLLDQKQVVPFIVDYVAKSDEAEPLKGGRTLLQLGDRILEIAETDGQATAVTPLLVTMFVDSAMSRARKERALDDLPQDVPEIFVDYLRRVNAGAIMEDEFIRAVRVIAHASLGRRRVPGDITTDEAGAALETIRLTDRSTTLLESLTAGGVLERRTFGGIDLLRFNLDPVAEYMASIQFVNELRNLEQAEIVDRINSLTKLEGYPANCDGFLRALATCYRVYRAGLRLPAMDFPWERAQQEPPVRVDAVLGAFC